jgi:hypothetical protein
MRSSLSLKMSTGDDALKMIEREFPEIAGELHEETIEGLLHCQIAEFSRFTQMTIDTQDRASFRRVCDLFVAMFDDANAELENALNVSFLEHLDFADRDISRSWGYQLMPAKMRQAFDDMAAYNRRIHAGQQAGAGQPATRPVEKPEGRDKPQPEAEGRSL